MQRRKSTGWPFAALLGVVVAGCAPAYHSYSGCRVNCRYCIPPPLPQVSYPSCVCHSCAAEPYLSASLSPEMDERAGD